MSVPLVILLTPVFALTCRVDNFFLKLLAAVPMYEINAQVASSSHIAFAMACENLFVAVWKPFIAPCTISPPRMAECVQHTTQSSGGEGGGGEGGGDGGEVA